MSTTLIRAPFEYRQVAEPLRTEVAQVAAGSGNGRGRVAAGVATLLAAWRVDSASAHSEIRPTPDTLWSVWEPDPLVALGLVLISWLYLRGTGVLWSRAGANRGVRRWQVWAFFGGVVTFALATLTPLDALGGALFSGHMVQHLVVFLVAPMLFAASRPMLPLLWALPVSWRLGLSRWWSRRSLLTGVIELARHWVCVMLMYAGVLWLWHVPSLYDAALESQLAHAVEHASFMSVAFLFWSTVLDAGRPNGIGHGIALLMIFATALHSSALGALLTFADAPLYASHEPYTEAWGLTPLEDQQLAGVLMWVPMGLWFTATALTLMGLWIRAADRSVRRLELDGVSAFGRTHDGAANPVSRQRAVPGRS